MSYDNPRIQMHHTMMDIIIAMSDGNPGAVSVLSRIVRDNPKIDPDDFMGGVGPVLGLDTADIYGPDIWRLYKDVCEQNLIYMLALLRATQLGIVTESSVKRAIARGIYEDPLEGVLARVQARLPQFGQVTV